jgi:hypothetical protein
MQHVEALYWELSEAAIAGVIDSVRTTLAELVAEMRATMPETMTHRVLRSPTTLCT